MAARASSSTSSSDRRVAATLAWLRRRGSARNRAGMARFGIVTPRALGVSTATMRPLARRLGRDHALAERLWATGWHEARILAGFVAEPAALTPRAMDRWARDFDTWALTDSTCLRVFSRSPHAWGRVAAWRRRRGEQPRRAAFALLAALAVHDRSAPDAVFVQALPWLVEAAGDERPYVRKAVNWALRQIGKRNRRLHVEALATAASILALGTPAARWIARDARRELQSPATRMRLARRA